MSIFAELKSKLDQAITGVNRYNPNNVDTLESCIEAMVQENQYDKDILVTTLKLYQLNPDKFVCFWLANITVQKVFTFLLSCNI